MLSAVSSPLEKDVLDILIKGEQPLIVALAKRMIKKIPPYFQKAFHDNRLLLISCFDEKVIRASIQTASARNKMMIDLADEIVVDYCSEKGNLKRIISQLKKTG